MEVTSRMLSFRKITALRVRAKRKSRGRACLRRWWSDMDLRLGGRVQRGISLPA